MAASKPSAERLITENIDVWTSAIKKRGSQGRGSSKKTELYGIKKLRELILELAVRGLLVPQNPKDEPASVLLEKIAAEKEQLIKDGKIKKQKPLAENSEGNKSFDLPNGWESSLFGDIALIERGGSPRPIKSFLTEDPAGLNWIKIGDTEQGGKYITSTNERIIKEGLAKTRMVYPGDFLLTNSMSFGRPYISKITGCIHDGWLRISPPPSIDKDYLYILLSSPFIIKAFKKAAAGAVVLNLNADKVREVVVLIPPEAEQPRIVAKVNELMALCDQLEQQTETSLTAHQTLVETLLNTLLNAAQTTGTKESDSQTSTSQVSSFDQAWNRLAQHFDVLFTTEHSIDQLKQTILQLAVMGKLVPQDPNDEPASVLLEKIAKEKEQLIKNNKIKKQKPLPEISDDEKPFDLPKGWTYSRLGDLAYVFAGNSFKSGDFNETGSTRVIKITNVGVGELIETEEYLPENFTEKYKNYKVEEGDLVMALTRPYISNGLKVSSCPASYHNALLNQRVAAIRAFSNTQFLYQFMQSNFVLGLYRNRFGGSGLQPNLKMNDVTDLITPVPPETEQPRIVAKINELMAICDTLKKRLRETQTTQLYLADSMAEQALN